jgi:hypothetical protein
MAMSGTVRYPHYKGRSANGMKNRRKNKLAIERKEEAIRLHMKKQAEEKLRTLQKAQYAKEAREWESRYDF